MIFEEFNKYTLIEDNKNPFCNLYQTDDGCLFYVEPVFHTQLMGFKMHYPDKMNEILLRIDNIVKKNKKVIFTGNYEFPQTEVNDDEFIVLEINDVTDPLHIFVEDKSRGSDYGD